MAVRESRILYPMHTVVETPPFAKEADQIWSEARHMSTIPLEQVAQAIEADADEAIPGLRESLAEMAADERGRTYTREQLALRAARTALGLSQPAFARLLQTPVGTVRDWEQGRFPPPGSALLVARLAVEHPEVLRPYAAAS